jgi:hypothetical protein
MYGKAKEKGRMAWEVGDLINFWAHSKAFSGWMV